VLSNNDGCVISRSDEAKALGIRMGEPLFKIRDLVRNKNVTVFSSNYTLYGDLSDRVMSTLASIVPEIEIYSIDEAFLLLNETHTDLEQFGHHIRNTVKQHTGIPVGVGIAPTKTLAKLANKISKRTGGVCVIYPDKIEDAWNKSSLDDVWGIGRQHTKKLRAHFIDTIEQFVHQPEAWVHKNFSVFGLRTQRELNGISCIEMDDIADKKSICTSRSFGSQQYEFKALEEAIASHASSCAEKLRIQGTLTNSMHVTLSKSRFSDETGKLYFGIFIKLPEPTNNTTTLIRYAIEGLSKIYQKGHSYKKCGVIVMDIVPEETVQLNMFESIQNKKWNTLETTMDALNRKMGKYTLRHAVQGYEHTWRLRKENLSPNYTTDVKDVLVVQVGYK
jgi:DNA polymerase V